MNAFTGLGKMGMTISSPPWRKGKARWKGPGTQCRAVTTAAIWGKSAFRSDGFSGVRALNWVSLRHLSIQRPGVLAPIWKLTRFRGNSGHILCLTNKVDQGGVFEKLDVVRH